MTPLEIIQQFKLDTSTNKDDFLVAADLAQDHGIDSFAHLLRTQFDILSQRQQYEFGQSDNFRFVYYWAYGCPDEDGDGWGFGDGTAGGYGSYDDEDDAVGYGWGFYGFPEDNYCLGGGLGNGFGSSDCSRQESGGGYGSFGLGFNGADGSGGGAGDTAPDNIASPGGCGYGQPITLENDPRPTGAGISMVSQNPDGSGHGGSLLDFVNVTLNQRLDS